MNYLTQETGDAVRAQNPLMVDDIESGAIGSVSETITYNGKAAAGAITVNSLTRKPVFCTAGDRVGSFWGRKENLVRTYTSNLVSLVETAGSAAFVIVDPTYNLELAFETGTAPWRYVAKVYDRDGSSLYGWIAGVAASTNTYTFTVYSTRSGTTQDWIGSLLNFDNTMFSRVEIYKDQTSLTFGTGTALTTEVNYPFEGKLDQEKVMAWALALSNGEYGVDYSNGLIIGKKADTTASETVTYTISSNSVVLTPTTGGSTLIDDAAFGVATSQVTPIGFLADETAPDSVTEGDIGAPRITLDRRIITASQSTDDAAPETGTRANVIGALADETTPDSVDEGDVGYLRMTLNRRLHVTTDGDIPTTLTGGNKTVAVPGTAEALGASLACKSIYIRAKAANTTAVYVGDSAVDKDTSQQIILNANDFITIDIANRATVYVDAVTAAEGVDYLVMS